MQESWLAGEQRLCISMRIAANIWCIMNRAHGAKATANSAHRLRFGTHRSDEPEMPHCLSVGGRTVHDERQEERHGVFIVVLLAAAGEEAGEA